MKITSLSLTLLLLTLVPGELACSTPAANSRALASANENSLTEGSLAKPFAGKTAVFLGTSLTWQGLYLKSLQEKTGLAKIVNLGISGQLVRTMADALTLSQLEDVAFVSIEGSTNDYGHDRIAGTVRDSEDAQTLCGDLKHVVQKIRKLSPKVKIFIMNDTWRGAFRDHPIPPESNGQGMTLEAASQAMMDTAEFLKLPHWDAYHLSGIGPKNLDLYTQDHLHWNQLGANLIGLAYGEFINRQTP